MKKTILVKIVDYKHPYTGADGKKHPSVTVQVGEVIEIDGKETIQNKVMIGLAHPKGQYAKQYRTKLFGLCSAVETYGSIEDLK